MFLAIEMKSHANYIGKFIITTKACKCLSHTTIYFPYRDSLKVKTWQKIWVDDGGFQRLMHILNHVLA